MTYWEQETYLSWINWLRHSSWRHLTSFLGSLLLAWVNRTLLLFGIFLCVGWRWFSGIFIFILALLLMLTSGLFANRFFRRRHRAWRVALILRCLGCQVRLLLPILLRLAFGGFILRLKTVWSWSALGSAVLANRVIFWGGLMLVLATPVVLIRLVISLISTPACVPFDGRLGSCAAQVSDSL